MEAFESELLDSSASDRGWSLVETFSRTRRELPDEFEHGAEVLARHLEESGLPVKAYRPSIYQGVPLDTRLQCEGRSLPCKAAALSPAQAEFTAPLVHVPARDGKARVHTNDPALLFGEGMTRLSLAALIRGKVVLTEGLSNPARSQLLEELGALAIITINPGQAVHWGASSVVWGSPGMEDWGRLPGIVSMAVNRESGDWLIGAAARNAAVTIAADMLHGWFEQTLLTVDIPGNGPAADEFILLHGHMDSWDLGVGDNATGDAVLLEVARALHAGRRHLRRGVRIAWWPGHSAGRYAGSTWYADHQARELHRRCVAHLNCDSPGCRDAVDYGSIRGMAEAQPLVAGAVRDLFGQQCRLERPGRAGDYSFNNLGVSGAMLTSSMVPADERKRRGWYAVGGNGGSPTWHTEDDVLEVADRKILENDIRLYLLVAARLACSVTPPLDFRLPSAQIVRRIEDVQEIVGKAVDLGEHLTLAQALQAAVGTAYDGSQAAPRADRWPALFAASRSIVRAGYSEKGVYDQDPAIVQAAVPMLGAATEWGRHAAAAASLQRGANRLYAELENALGRL